MTNVVVVESPAKAKTINKYLGSEYKVLASYGHVRNLPKKNGSIDVENDFTPKWEVDPKSKKHLDEIVKALKSSSKLILATDPDREGEAIAWHICKVCGLSVETTKRILFHEITKPAITQAVQNPTLINMNTIYAQQARQILDFVVGFQKLQI